MESRSPPDAEIALLQQDEEMDLDEVIAEEGSLIRIGEDELTIPTANPSKKEIQEIKIAH
jgi:predicted mannosyl-3-phosphoglycerate phosphatase (HAD superfamily)